MSLVRPIIRPVARALVRRLSHGHGAFNPHVLFAAGEQGAWYDPSDFSTMSQDSAGTTPVTATGQPVGKILDKSGRGNHATQATASSRPTLQQDSGGRYYLNFDGVDDSLATASINFTGTDKTLVLAGVYKASDAAAGCVAELGSGLPVGSWYSAAPFSAADSYGASVRGGGTAWGGYSLGFAAPITNVTAWLYDLAGATAADIVKLRVNGIQRAFTTGGGVGGGTFSANPIYIGRRGGTSTPLNGRLYGLIVRGASTSASRLAQAESWMNSKTGAY